jgi:H+/Cl- antiporter ClcA
MGILESINRSEVEMARGLRIWVVVGLALACGVAVGYVWLRRRRAPEDGADGFSRSDPPAAQHVKDVARWEDEGGALTT